jgi:acetolactate synthase-1/2/3 large subunit
MELSGAQAVWECLVREGVDTVFGISGGAVIQLYHDLLDYPIRHVLMRHEQAAAHAADGYARATGRVGVCLATSGPGATNLITGIATAMMDSSPMVAITGQVSSPFLGTDAFQEVDITGATLPIVKHSYLVTDVADVPHAIRSAFHIARTGRPGPVLVDITKDAQMAKAEFAYPEAVDLPGYRPDEESGLEHIGAAAQLLNEARRPLVIAGRGTIISGAHQELRQMVETANLPVVTTLLGIGILPETHPLCLRMGGMHGEVTANRAVQAADVILAIGMRFDDRFTGAVSAFAPHATIIHIDIDAVEIDKNVIVQLPIRGDARDVLQRLLPLVRPAERRQWWAEIEEWRKDTANTDILSRKSTQLLPQYVIRTIWEATQGNAIMVSDVGQNQMWEAQYYLHQQACGLISSGGLGTMGFGLPAGIGAVMGRPEETTWVIAGDGGFQMTMQELAVVAHEKLPLKIAVLNNGYLGMVRQWQEEFFDRRYSATELFNPDFARLAEAYGIQGIVVEGQEEVGPAVKEAMDFDGPVLLEFRIEREQNVYPLVAPGKALDQMIRRPQRVGRG